MILHFKHNLASIACMATLSIVLAFNFEWMIWVVVLAFSISWMIIWLWGYIEHAYLLHITLMPWKTIKLGNGLKTSADFDQAIRQASGNSNGVSLLEEPITNLIDHPSFKVSDQPTRINLVIASVKKLGFVNGATLQQIYATGLSLGWILCPTEAGPQLRLQSMDQDIGEEWFIATEPIKDIDSDRYCLFIVGCDDRGYSWDSDCIYRWLDAVSYRPDHIWPSNTQWVFRKKAP